MNPPQQAIVTVPAAGEPDVFLGSFRQFIAARGLPNAGPIVASGGIYCSVVLGDRPSADAYWNSARRSQIEKLSAALFALGLSPHLPCPVTVAGERFPCTVSMLPDIPGGLAARRRDAARPPSRQMLAAEKLGAAVIDGDLRRMTLSRVVWGEPTSIVPHDPETVGLAAVSGMTPGIGALHVGDPDFWVAKLADDYGRDGEAFEISIIPAPGDVLVADVQYALPEDDGTRGDSAILLTSRRVLRPGRDFHVVRRLEAEASMQPSMVP